MRLIRLAFLVSSLVFVLSAREQVNINFSNLEINDFIKLTSKITNKNILINNRLSGTVNFVSSTPVYDDELIDILISVLESKGYTLVRNGSLYKVVRSTEASQQNVSVMAQGKNVYGSLMVTQAIKIEGENVDIIAAKIRYLISKTAKLMTLKESNTILITDYPKNIQTIKKVIGEIDTHKTFIVKIVHIKNTEVKKLQARLLDISKSIFNAKISSEAVKLVLDKNINGIIIIGNKENVARIEELIVELDVESNVDNSVKIFSLKNSDAKLVLASLNEIIAKQIYSDPSLKPSVSMSEDINAIIAIGEPAIVKGLKLIIDELDREKFQVYVQARIIEINKNDAQNIGIKYGFAAGDVSSSGLYAMSTNFGDGALSGTASAAVLDALGKIGSATKSALALGAAIDFLQTKGASNTISNPSILCVNNKESSIYVGKTISVSSGTTTGTVGTTSSFQREDVGLTLKIKPRVSSKDKVTLDVETVLESVLDDGSNNKTGQPITSKQKVKTQAILRHGESIIIGGLVKNSSQNGKTKIPLLGDIPFLGEYLFSSKSETNSEDNLIVILTPYVIDNSENLSQLQKNLGELVSIQRAYNKKVFEKIENSETSQKKNVEKEDSTNDNVDEDSFSGDM